MSDTDQINNFNLGQVEGAKSNFTKWPEAAVRLREMLPRENYLWSGMLEWYWQQDLNTQQWALELPEYLRLTLNHFTHSRGRVQNIGFHVGQLVVACSQINLQQVVPINLKEEGWCLFLGLLEDKCGIYIKKKICPRYPLKSSLCWLNWAKFHTEP